MISRTSFHRQTQFLFSLSQNPRALSCLLTDSSYPRHDYDGVLGGYLRKCPLFRGFFCDPSSPSFSHSLAAENISKGKTFPPVLVTFSMHVLLQFLNVAIVALRNLNSSLENTTIQYFPSLWRQNQCQMTYTIPVKSALDRLKERRIFIKLKKWGLAKAWVTQEITKEKNRDLTQIFFYLQKKGRKTNTKHHSLKNVCENDKRLIYLLHRKFIETGKKHLRSLENFTKDVNSQFTIREIKANHFT